jgi:hypothetical protein
MDHFFPCIYNLFCRVGVKLPTVEVRYKNLLVEAKCEVVHRKPLGPFGVARPSPWLNGSSQATPNIFFFFLKKKIFFNFFKN